MPANTPDQQITLPIGADPADNPVAFIDAVADLEVRLVREYTSVADRTARMVSLAENDISTLAAEDRVEVYDGTNQISLFTRALYASPRVLANQTLTQNTTVLQNVTSVSAPVPTAGTFAFRGMVYYSSSTAADIKFAWLLPAGATVLWNGLGMVTGSTGTGDATFTTVAASDATVACGGGGVGVILSVQIEGTYVAGGTAGTLQFRAAQNTADLSNTVVHAHTRFDIWRLA